MASLGSLKLRAALAPAALIALVALGAHCAGGARRPTSVLLVVLDTTRADVFEEVLAHAGSGTRRLVEDGVTYTRARSTSAWTLPAHGSLFTGLYPSRHGAHHESHLLGEDRVTLAELLAPSHATAGFSENPHIGERKGFTQGFEQFDETWRGVAAGQEPPTIERVLEWLDARGDDERPFFLFVNLMDAHLPYAPPDALARTFLPDLPAERLRRGTAFGERDELLFVARRLTLSEDDLALLRGLYRADVVAAGRRLDRIVEALDAAGRLEGTLVVVVGDHGESIGEHALIGHQLALWETLLRVPLVLRLPGTFDRGERRDAPVQLVDVMPTVLDAAGVPRDAWPAFEGQSLCDGDPPADRPIVAEYMRPVRQQQRFERVVPGFDFTPYDRRLKSFQVGSLKLIRPDRGAAELYDLAGDPGETRDLAPTEAALAARMGAELDAWLARGPTAEVGTEPELDPETLDALRSLGYVE